MRQLIDIINERLKIDKNIEVSANDELNPKNQSSIDHNLKIGVDISTSNPTEYNVTYIDKRGNTYKAKTSDFEMRKYAEVALECLIGIRSSINKSWQNKLIKWVKQYKIS